MLVKIHIDKLFKVNGKLFVKRKGLENIMIYLTPELNGAEIHLPKENRLPKEMRMREKVSNDINYKNVIGLKDFISVVFDDKVEIMTFEKNNGEHLYGYKSTITQKIKILSSHSFELRNDIILLMSDFTLNVYNITKNSVEKYDFLAMNKSWNTLKIFNGNKYLILIHELGKYTILYKNNNNDFILNEVELDKYIINIHNHNDKIYVLTKSQNIKIYEVKRARKNINKTVLIEIISLNKNIKLTNEMTSNEDGFSYLAENDIIMTFIYKNSQFKYSLLDKKDTKQLISVYGNLYTLNKDGEFNIPELSPIKIMEEIAEEVGGQIEGQLIEEVVEENSIEKKIANLFLNSILDSVKNSIDIKKSKNILESLNDLIDEINNDDYKFYNIKDEDLTHESEIYDCEIDEMCNDILDELLLESIS